MSGRLALSPITGLTIGGSAARGEWLDSQVSELLPAGARSHAQTAVGADAEYSRDHWLLRAEILWSRWVVPLAAEASDVDLDALGTWIEGRYRLTPRIFVAARLDHLGFSEVTASTGERVSWDAPTTRVETSAGYYLQRNLVVRAAVQFNDRDGGRVARRTYFSGQIAYWF